jgi:hypothetical protein
MGRSTGSRAFGREFLAALPDHRIGALFEDTATSRPTHLAEVQAQLLLSAGVLERQSLSELHAAAAIQEARMSFLTAQRPEQVLEAFGKAREIAVGRQDSAKLAEADSQIEALLEPRSPRAFRQSKALIEDAVMLPARIQGSWIVAAALDSWKSGQVKLRTGEIIEPDVVSGVARAAFEFSDSETLDFMLAEARGAASGHPDLLAEVAYYSGMHRYAQKQYGEAAVLFAEASGSGSASELAAYADLQHASSLYMAGQLLEAAAVHSETALRWRQYPEVVRQSESAKEYVIAHMIRNQGIGMDEVHAMVDQKVKERSRLALHHEQ